MTQTKVSSFTKITFDDIADAVDEVLGFEYTNFAPLGRSSATLVLCGIDGNERREGVSMRLHSGTIEMLICNSQGSFLFYGHFHPCIGRDLIKAEFFRIFESVKHYIKSV